MVDLVKLLKDIDDDIELTEILGESPEFNLRCKVAIRELAAERDALKAEIENHKIKSDAYEIACDDMEVFQRARAKSGKHPGTQGSLCDGMRWVYSRINELEDELEASRATPPVCWIEKKYLPQLQRRKGATVTGRVAEELLYSTRFLLTWAPLYRGPQQPRLTIQLDRTLGGVGTAYDMPGPQRAYTHKHPPSNNSIPYRLGAAAISAVNSPHGDNIDIGLYLLRALHEKGLGIFEIERLEPEEQGGKP